MPASPTSPVPSDPPRPVPRALAPPRGWREPVRNISADSPPPPPTWRRSALCYATTLALFGVCFAQLRWRQYFSAPLLSHPAAQQAALMLLMASIPVAGWAVCAGGSRRLRLVAALFCFACAGFGEELHFYIVDVSNFDPRFKSNFEWQWNLHNAILALTPGVPPHVYRFLPDCIVSVFQWLTGSVIGSIHGYRLLADTLLYATIYRYARLYLTAASALGVVAVVAAFYPITILRYNGQFTDPASHLSFALCYYFLATRHEPGFQCSLLAGLFAKESVLTMAIGRAFYGGNRLRAYAIAAGYFALGLAVTLASRRFVNGAPIPVAFTSISGTQATQFLGNLATWHVWWGMYAVTLGALLPGAIAGWRLLDASFRATCLVVVAATVGSNLVISLMWEERNVVPAFIPLAILNFKYLEHVLRASSREALAFSR